MFRLIDGRMVEEGQVLDVDDPKEYIAGKPLVRKFETGATRNPDDDKYDYEAFFCPLVLERRAKYMHGKRFQADGSMRSGDNWQKGIPLDSYAKSLARHHHDFWMLHRGYSAFDETGKLVDLEEAICAAMFNLEGYLSELLKRRRPTTVKVTQVRTSQPFDIEE